MTPWRSIFEKSDFWVIFVVFWGILDISTWERQVWPSGAEPGSQPQAPGSIPPSPLWDPTSVLGLERTLRGLFFTKKSVLKMRNNGFP